MRLFAAAVLLIAIPAARGADLTISTASDSNITFAGGVFTGSSTSPSNLNVMTLSTALATSNVKVVAVSGGAGNGDIFVANNIAWASSSSLRLEAYRNIVLGTSTITNTGGATVQLRADSTATGFGTISAATGSVTTTGGIVEAFYNPIVFGTPDTLYVGGTTPIAYMLVNSLTNLQNIGLFASNLSRNFALGRDIDASSTVAMNSGAGFAPIGTTAAPFTGRFNGEGHAIADLFINRPSQDNVGLFGVLSNATVRNIAVRAANVTARNSVGALAGSVSGTTAIVAASSSGNVTATGTSGGGLAGLSQGSFTTSKSSATVSAATYAGGLIGLANATIADCYATGAVNGGAAGFTGGLVGYNFNAITRVYSAGAVTASGGSIGGLIGFNNGGSITNAYWDTQTSGRATSSGGTGLITSQMKQQANFTAFDFVNTWTIVENLTYPHFGISDPAIVTTSGGTTAFVEADGGTSPAVVIDAAITVSDIDSATLSSATISITAGFQTAEDVMEFVNDGATMGNIAGTYDSSTGVLTLTSSDATATVPEWLMALRTVTYANTSDLPNTATRTIAFVVNDGTSDSAPASKLVSVTSTNDTPHVSAPATIGVTADVAAPITGIVLSDVDADNATVTATLTVDAGTLSAISGGGVTVGGSASSMTLSGSIANINGFIAASNITFTTESPAIVTLTSHLDDGGNTGDGGAKNGSASTLLQVVPATPVLLSATASSDTAVTVTWTPVAGATGYEIHRTLNIATPFTYAGSATNAENTFNDTSRDANTTYLYKVLATGSAGPSQLSNVDAATTTPFTDATLEDAAVKGVHILEIRKAVNAMLIAANQTATFSTADPAGVAIAAQDIIDLITALDTARSQIGLPALSYSNPPPAPAVTAIRAADFYDLRSGVE